MKQYKLTHSLLNVNNNREFQQDDFSNNAKTLTQNTLILPINATKSLYSGLTANNKTAFSLGYIYGTESSDYTYLTNQVLNDNNLKFMQNSDTNILIRQIGTRYIGFFLEGEIDSITCHYVFCAIVLNRVYFQTVTEYNTEFGKWSLSNRAAIESEFLTDGEFNITIPISGIANDIICRPLTVNDGDSGKIVLLYHSFVDENINYQWFININAMPDSIYFNVYTMFNPLG